MPEQTSAPRDAWRAAAALSDEGAALLIPSTGAETCPSEHSADAARRQAAADMETARQRAAAALLAAQRVAALPPHDCEAVQVLSAIDDHLTALTGRAPEHPRPESPLISDKGVTA